MLSLQRCFSLTLLGLFCATQPAHLPAQNAPWNAAAANGEAAAVPCAVVHQGDSRLRDALIQTGEVWIDAGTFLVGQLAPADLEGLRAKGFDAQALTGLAATDELFLVDLSRPEVQQALERSGRALFQHESQALVAVTASSTDLPEELQPGRTCHAGHTWVRRRAAQPTSALVVAGQALQPGAQFLGTPDARIQALVNAMDKANIQGFVTTLASNFTRVSTNATAIDTARNQIASQLVGLGYGQPAFQTFQANHGDNVVLTIPGAVDPTRIVVLGAHYDSINGGGSSLAAPGADDNASGSASLVEIARVLKTGGPLKYTVRLMWFAGEEFGLLGSDFDAQQAATQNQNVLAMINMDMNAYRAAGDVRDCDLVTNDTTATLQSFCNQMGQLYVPTWASTTGVLTAGTSDHRSYFQAGFPSAFLFEDVSQFYSQIHTANDTLALATTDYDLSLMIARAVLASAVQIAGPVDMTIAHTELPDTTNASGPYAVSATINSLTAANVAAASVFYSTDGGQNFASLPMSGSGNVWTANIPSQGSPKTISYYIQSTDSQGFTEALPEGAEFGAALFDFFVGTKQVLQATSFEEAGDNGWTHGAISGTDDWQRGVPMGKSGDPSQAFQGSNAWGNDLGPTNFNGAYPNNAENWLRSPTFDLSGASNVTLEFRRWLGVESSQFDQASVRVNGQIVWQNPATADLVDSTWVPMSIDVSTIAAGNSAVQVEFRLKSDAGVTFGGWNVDDFKLVELGPGSGSCPTPLGYCTPKVSSSGCVPALTASGVPSLSAPSGFTIQSAQIETAANGLMFFGTTGQNNAPFQDGFLCVSAPLHRLGIQNSAGAAACQGTFAYSLADLLANATGGSLITLGQTVDCQTWFRDPPALSTTGLTAGLEFQACP